jgi:3-deoxy-D-manno-octulosonate 8-phosphate phosphatase (KDO 8-P phosphatase)
MIENFSDIKLLAMDCDGVLTDGGIYIGDDGTESRKFNVKDGAWLRIWKRLGLETAIITGKESDALARRAKDLNIDYLYQKAHYKAEAFEKLLADSSLAARQMVYIGDDIIDLPVMREVGFSVAVADAVDEVKQLADWVTSRNGGQGAVQETIHYLLEKMGLRNQALQRYHNKDLSTKTQ